LQLLLTYDFPPMGGGIARWMGELAKRYPAGSLIVSTGQYEGEREADQLLPNRVDRLPIAAARLRTVQGTIRWARRVAALAAGWGAEFSWCGNIKPAAYPARWALVRMGVPYGILVHGGDLLILQRQIRRSRLKRRAARALLQSASVLVSNSRWTGALCGTVLEELGINALTPRLEIVPLGADPAVFRPGLNQSDVRNRYRLDPRRWLLSVARLTRHKGIDTGIKVLGRLARHYPDLGYIVVGTGEELASLQKLAHTLGIADRVQFLTGVPDADLPALYNCAEVYLGLSRRLDQRVEGFGISLVEAASCGIPVVAGRTGGVPEAVHDGETGVLVDAELPEQVEGVLQRLLDDSALRSRLGEGGRRAVESFYNWDRVTGDLSRIGSQYGRPPRVPGRSGR
jgi:phosphatidyl-myo-inositol dimannoside synthase